MLTEYQPKSYPNDLLAKDWKQRKVFHRYGTIQFSDQIHEFEVREDDVWIVTLPKCGTTWMQEMVWLLLNDCNFEQAKSEPLELRSPYIEFVFFLQEDIDAYFDNLSKMKSPRLIKSHFPLPLLPKQLWTKKPKTIYVFRNPSDAMISSYYFHQNFGLNINESLAEVIEHELEEEKRTLNHWNHVLEFYELRHQPWMHYTSFERMKMDLRSELKKVCQFLNVKINEENEEKLLKHLSFEEMKNNPQVNHNYEIEIARKKQGNADYTYKNNKFMRKGEVGNYKKELPAELIAKLDQWIKESLEPHKLTLNDLLLL